MRKIILVMIFLHLALATFAERIDGPANVRTAPKGIPILSLLDNVNVGCSVLDSGWYTIIISLEISQEQYESDSPINKGDSLFNWQKEFIGTALRSIPDSLSSTWYSGGGPGNPVVYGIDIYASTFQSNIKPESIPEIRLALLLSKSNYTPTKQDLMEYMAEFQFSETNLLKRFENGYEELMIYESGIYDPSPMDRIRLIFQESQLLAIIHTRPINNTLESIALVRDRNIMILKEFNSAEKRKFIQMNKEAYDGVD